MDEQRAHDQAFFNQLGEKLCAVPKDTPEWLKIRNEIWLYFLELAKGRIIEYKRTYSGEIVDEALDKTLGKNIRDFDASKSPLTPFCFTMLRWRIKEILRSKYHNPKKKDDEGKEDENKEKDDVEKKGILKESVGLSPKILNREAEVNGIVEDPLESLAKYESIDCYFQELTTNIINFKINQTGRKSTQKEQYYRAFYTDEMTYYIRNVIENVARLENIKNEIAHAMEQDFLDYYMSEKCENLEEIQNTELKTWGDLIPKLYELRGVEIEENPDKWDKILKSVKEEKQDEQLEQKDDRKVAYHLNKKVYSSYFGVVNAISNHSLTYKKWIDSIKSGI